MPRVSQKRIPEIQPEALFLAGTAGEMAYYPPIVRQPVKLFRFIVLESAQASIQL